MRRSVLSILLRNAHKGLASARREGELLVRWCRAGAACALFGAATLLGQESKLAPDLAGIGAEEEVDVIIQLADEPEGSARGRREVSFPRPAALNARRPVRELQSIRGLVTRVAGGSLAALARDPQVKYITPDREVRSSTNYAQFSVGAITANQSGFTGRGVGVAVVDSGVFSNHSDLREPSCSLLVRRITYAEDFVGDMPPTGSDPWGHGTAVAGLVAGNGRCRAIGGGVPRKTIDNNPDRRLSGVAPEANLIDLRVLDSTGKGVDSTVIRAIDKAIWLKNNQPALNLRVINLSLEPVVNF